MSRYLSRRYVLSLYPNIIFVKEFYYIGLKDFVMLSKGCLNSCSITFSFSNIRKCNLLNSYEVLIVCNAFSFARQYSRLYGDCGYGRDRLTWKPGIWRQHIAFLRFKHRPQMKGSKQIFWLLSLLEIIWKSCLWSDWIRTLNLELRYKSKWDCEPLENKNEKVQNNERKMNLSNLRHEV